MSCEAAVSQLSEVPADSFSSSREPVSGGQAAKEAGSRMSALAGKPCQSRCPDKVMAGVLCSGKCCEKRLRTDIY